jgi:hypothetical protein
MMVGRGICWGRRIGFCGYLKVVWRRNLVAVGINGVSGVLRRFEVLVVALKWVAIFCDMTPCVLVYIVTDVSDSLAVSTFKRITAQNLEATTSSEDYTSLHGVICWKT